MEDEKPILWMHFIRFSDMTPEDREELQFVCDFMNKHRALHNPIFSNGACIRTKKATKKILGDMYAAGWRGAQVPCMCLTIY